MIRSMQRKIHRNFLKRCAVYETRKNRDTGRPERVLKGYAIPKGARTWRSFWGLG